MNAIDEERALALTQKDQEFKDSIQTLKDNQTRLDIKYESLREELKNAPDGTEKEREDFHKLREAYDKVGIADAENRKALEQKEAEYKKLQEENKSKLGQEADGITPPTIQSKTSDPTPEKGYNVDNLEAQVAIKGKSVTFAQMTTKPTTSTTPPPTDTNKLTT